MNARERADLVFRAFGRQLPSEEAIEIAVNGLLGPQQNPPPHGEADGTLSERRWNMLRDLIDHVREGRRLVRLYQED